MILKKSSTQRVKYGTLIKFEGILKSIFENTRDDQNTLFGKYTETIKLCPLDVYVCQFLMCERISFNFLHNKLISFRNVMHLNKIHLITSRTADNSENTGTLKIKSHNINSLCVHHNSQQFKHIKTSLSKLSSKCYAC